MALPPTVPYWRLASFYFFYFAGLGVFVPYWGLYLQSNGLDNQAIGEITAAFLAMRIIAPNFWGWLADSTQQTMQIVRIIGITALCIFALFLNADHYYSFLCIIVLFAFFWDGLLPLFETNTLRHLGEDSHRYSHIRLWGSLGFIIVVVGLGHLLDYYAAKWIPISFLVILFSLSLVAWTVPDARQLTHTSPPKLGYYLRQPVIIVFFIICFFNALGHAPYYTFYSLYLAEYDYSGQTIGFLWALGVIAEILLFLVIHHWLLRYGIRYILVASLLLASLRWLLIGHFADQLLILLAAQLLHAASFAAFHSAAIAWLHHHFSDDAQSRGQALYSSVSFGLGGGLGSLISGHLWESHGPTWLFSFSAALTCLAMCLALLALSKNN